MKSINKILGIGLLFCSAAFSSCTNLDETIYSEVTADNYYKSADEVVAAMMRPWGHFCGSMTVAQSPWILQELTADGAAWPQKGRHGYDGGAWIRLHRHEWTAIENEVRTTWKHMFMGIGLANNFLADIETIDFEQLKVPFSKEQAVAEMKMYRAFCYWQLMDLYGGVPIVESIGIANPESKTREEVFNFIEKEVLENVDNLSDDIKTTYGRVSKWGAYAMLAKLYINAEVYTGKARLDECIAACEKLDNAGFTLDTKWNEPFKADNNISSKENIWVIVFDQIYAKGMAWGQRWLHYAHQKAWNLQAGAWNGLVTQPSFYSSFGETDKRRNDGFAIGPQFPRKIDANGDYYFDTTLPQLTGSEEYKDKPLVLVNEIKSMTEGEENSGARSMKYEIEEGADGNQNNDWVLLRYSDIKFIKAEALMRKNNGVATQPAVDLINSVRARAFADGDPKAKYTTATLTMDELLVERGREFAFEGMRRSDMVRFGKFVTTAWWDHKPSVKESYNLFPIPQPQLDSNPNLKPNIANQ